MNKLDYTYIYVCIIDRNIIEVNKQSSQINDVSSKKTNFLTSKLGMRIELQQL